VVFDAGKKAEGVQIPADQQPVFSISPEKILLPSKESTTFMISGLSSKAGKTHLLKPARPSWPWYLSACVVIVVHKRAI
jgi:hypothetical protein